MEILNLARGPGLIISLAVFILGSLWRLAGILRRPNMRDLSPAREGAPTGWVGALRAVVHGMWPRKEFAQAALGSTINGYVFHIGLALVFFGYAPHISFIRRLTGLSWPALPDMVMYLAAGATIVALLLALASRLTDPVLRKISSADDIITWAMVILPVITGMAVVVEPSTAILSHDYVIHPVPLAIHLLTLELLLLWFPFGKLMHAFLFVFSRGATGMRLSHRGVEL